MTYLDLINAFERWLENNYLPGLSQLLYYKFLVIFNRSVWAEWVSVDNTRLMALAQINNEGTLLRHRDHLIQSGLIEYRKGKKGTPNRYRLNTAIFKVQIKVETEGEMKVFPKVKTEVETEDINRYKTKNKTKTKNIKKDKSEDLSKKSEKTPISPTVEKMEQFFKEQGVKINAKQYVEDHPEMTRLILKRYDLSNTGNPE